LRVPAPQAPPAPADTIAPVPPSILDRIAGSLSLDPSLVIRSLMELAVIWASAWVAMQILRLIVRRILRLVSDKDDRTLTAAEKRGQTIAGLVRSVGRTVVIIAALLLTLDIFLDIRALLAGVGILGLAISFGAQSLVKDVISGFFILFENQFVVGDVIEASGKTGTVERITLRSVSLRELDGTLHTIPNGLIGVVSNKTRSWSRAVVEVSVSQGVDLDRTLELFREEAARFYDDKAWHARFEGAPEVPGVEAITDTRVVIRTLLRTVAGSQWDIAREFRRRIRNRLAAEAKQARQKPEETT
jgi:moderate conductance mechanosensitive channel